MQRSHSLHLRGNEGDPGMGSPASPGGTMWPPNSPAPVQRSISVLLLDHHSSIGIGPPHDDDHHDHHENSKAPCCKSRLRAEQTVHLIPLVLFLCALILWLGAQSEPSYIDIGANKGTSNLLAFHESHQRLVATHQNFEDATFRRMPNGVDDALKQKMPLQQH
eukprot:c16772_g1_i1 orf=88-576(-)